MFTTHPYSSPPGQQQSKNSAKFYSSLPELLVMRSRVNIILFSALLMLISVIGVQANIIRVSTTGNNGNNGSSWAAAKRNIQSALNAAVSGDQVWVATGTYNEHLTVQIGVELYGGFAGSENALTDRVLGPTPSVVDGGGSGNVINCSPGYFQPHRVDGFTIQHGNTGINIDASSPIIINNIVTGSSGAWASGISGANSFSTIQNNTITNNHGVGDGGGILFIYSTIIIQGNTISGNSSGSGRYGGGIDCYETSATIVNNTISNNSAYYAGAIWLQSGYAVIQGNTVSGNSAHRDGGVLTATPMVLIQDNNITGNSADIDGAGGLSVYGAKTATIENNTIQNNSSPLYGGVIVGYGGTDLTFTNNTVSNNTSPNDAGVQVSGAKGRVSGNTITGNTAANGIGGLHLIRFTGIACQNTITNNSGGYVGGLRAATTACKILYNVISGNSSGTIGGGIDCDNSSSTIANNLVSNNSAVNGGGIFLQNSSNAMVINNTVAYNTASAGVGGIGVTGSTPNLANNIVAFNSSGIATDTTFSLNNNCVYGNASYNYNGISSGAGDISSDPAFANSGGGNFHILNYSPCMDAGDDSAILPGWTDLDALFRIKNLHVDMGAYEIQGLPAILTNITVTSPSGLVGKNVTLSATLRRSDTKAKLAGKTVNFEVDGAFVGSGITNLSGTATYIYFIPASTPLGAHTVTGKFAADGTFAPSAISGTLNVIPPVVSGVKLSPAIVKGGVQNSVGTVTLSGIAPVGDLVVTLSSSDATAATVPATVTVTAGSKTATFPVTSQVVSLQKKPVITATTGIVNKLATLTVNP